MAERTKKAKKTNEEAVLEKIAEMPDPYRAVGERLHELILESNPELKPKLWYGMPGYAKSGPVLCYFRVDQYMTFGLTEKADFNAREGALDQLTACAWFFTKLDDAAADRIAGIVREATS